MNRKILGAAVILMLICMGSFFYMRKSSSGVSGRNRLIIGTAAGYAPFVSINPEGQYEGFDIDVAYALGNEMDTEIVVEDYGSMTALFTALDQGKIDAIIWGLSITKPRLEKVAMIHYYGAATESYPLIFWNSIPASIQSIADMVGKTICVEPGSAQDAVMQKYNDIIPLCVEKVDDALLNLQYGKVDAAFVEPAIAQKFKNKYPQIQIMPVPLAPEDQEQGIGIAVKRTNVERIDAIEKAIQELKKSGVINQLEKKWNLS